MWATCEEYPLNGKEFALFHFFHRVRQNVDTMAGTWAAILNFKKHMLRMATQHNRKSLSLCCSQSHSTKTELCIFGLLYMKEK